MGDFALGAIRPIRIIPSCFTVWEGILAFKILPVWLRRNAPSIASALRCRAIPYRVYPGVLVTTRMTADFGHTADARPPEEEQHTATIVLSVPDISRKHLERAVTSTVTRVHWVNGANIPDASWCG